MEGKTQSGYLLLAEISGYASFVAQTEIEHADKALSLLLDVVIQKLTASFTIMELEGNAVFFYKPESELAEGNSLFAVIDAAYSMFRDSARELYDQTTCLCRACRALTGLDLSFILHYGEYILQPVAGIQRLLGNDIVLLHRLMKNHVTESTGWRGYGLFTDRALQKIHADHISFVEQCETYEHLGEVKTFVMELHSRDEEI